MNDFHFDIISTLLFRELLNVTTPKTSFPWRHNRMEAGGACKESVNQPKRLCMVAFNDKI